MKKKVLFLLSILYFTATYSQSDSAIIDSMGKYSYPLTFSKGKDVGWATGFFIRKNNRLFLVSNYHVFTSKTIAFTSERIPKFDSLWLIYKKASGGIKGYLINVKEIQRRNKNYLNYEIPDLYIYEIKKPFPSDALIYSIESFIDTVPGDLDMVDFFTEGYGGPNAGNYFNPKVYHFTPYMTIYDTAYLKPDYYITHSYWANNIGEQGISGSPLFATFKDKDKIIIRFLGVAFGKYNGKQFIVKPQEVSNELKKLINKK